MTPAHARGSTPALALTAALALAAGCPSTDAQTTDDPATATATAPTAPTGDGSASDGSATAPTTSPTTGEPATTGTTGAATATTGDGVTVTTGPGPTSDATTGPATTGPATTGESTTGDSTSSDTTGSTGFDTTTGSTGFDTTTGSTGVDTTTGDTTGGGDIDPFFPACDVLAVSEPILLEDLGKPGTRKSPATLAYDGTDLVIVRDDVDAMTNKCETLFERRDPTTGALLGPGVRSPAIGACNWNGALGYDPDSDTFLFLSQTIVPNLALTALDAKGNKLWQKGEWALCNSLVQSMDVRSRGGEWIILGETHSCGGTGDRFTSIQSYSTAGQRNYWIQTAKETASAGGAACDLPACDRALTLRYGLEGQDSGTWAQMADLTLGKLDAKKTKLNGIAYGGWDANAAVWNGTDWLVVRVEDTGPSQKTHVRRWDENLGWTTPDHTYTAGESPTEYELLWTGHDYIGAYAAFPDLNTQLPSDWFTFDIYLVLFGADASIKKVQIFERPKGFGGYAPQLVPLPGAIGLSWVRVTKEANNSLTYTRHLSRITCAG